MTYCEAAPGHPWHGPYHDQEYGFPVREPARLLERLALEIMQAGLSWETVLKKRAALQAAFEGFDPARVAAYGETERARLLADAGIIRNRRKIDAIISNAGVILAMAPDGGFAAWLDAHHPLDKAAWVALFRRTFRFTGVEITGEFLISTGYLPGAHHPGCPIYAPVAALNPPWLVAGLAPVVHRWPVP